MNAVRRQRARLVDLLGALTPEQWAAETMCRGWDAGDVAAHLVVREREPWAAAGIVLPPLRRLTDARTAARKRAGQHALVERLRSGPPLPWTLGFPGRLQVAEDYIHAEDVRRGGAADLREGSTADLEPDDGTGDAEREQVLWGAVARFATLTLRGVRAEGVLAMTDGTRTRAYTLGTAIARPAGDRDLERTATVTAPAGELLLFATGRVGARVEVSGPDDLVEALGASRRRV
jgi:uncharacterized protein (TIGR03085 family)